MLKVVLWVAGGIAVLLRLLLYAEVRGRIYYRRKKPTSSAPGNACLEVQQLLEPSKKYVVQIKKDERREQQEAGDLPLEERGRDFRAGNPQDKF